MIEPGRFFRGVAISLAAVATCALTVLGCGADAEHSKDAGSEKHPASGTGGATGVRDQKFSFFVTSLAALQRLSGNPNGFGGDLRYGEADGLSGADKICTEIAESTMKGSGAKGWRAFLSAVKGPKGEPVHAIDRIGKGPWYDRVARIVAMNKEELLGVRPQGADPAIIDNLPNEDGVPNHDPDGTGAVDNHDTLTGTDKTGHVYSMDPEVTCEDWTTSKPVGRPRVGHTWPRFAGGMAMLGFPGGGSGDGGFPMGFPMGGFPGGGGDAGGVDSSCFFNQSSGGGGLGDYGNWMSSLSEAGCAPVIYLKDDFAMDCATRGVGSGGGYGAFYCFALTP